MARTVQGTACEYCKHQRHSIVGVLYPSAVDGDDSRAWIERCDLCCIYESDEAAAQALVDAGLIEEWRSAPVAGLSGTFPYEVGSGVWPHPRNAVRTLHPKAIQGERRGGHR